jgi:hypothetical protein
VWFESLFGIPEDPAGIPARFTVDGSNLIAPNGRRFGIGTLTTPSLGELRARATSRPGRPTVRERVGDVASLHADPANAGALFQVASQFNLLEMPSPAVTPEHGITNYIHDRTQGPACALSAAAATLYRNALVPLDGRPGQRADRQIDTFAEVGALLAGSGGALPYRMVNGYALFHTSPALDGLPRDTLRRALRVGLHAEVEVTLPGTGHQVTQVFGSALPLAYMDRPTQAVADLAAIVLEASYEATLRLAAENAARTGNRQVFLTLLGGGVFGNAPASILSAIDRALATPGLGDLDVQIVSYGRSDPDVRAFVSR